MIISLFGPDGVGKSTITKELSRDGWIVFSGTDVASWPDKSWHTELIAKGIDEASLDNGKHFIEKITRAHQLAQSLVKDSRFVVIDSDPFHKTLIHDYLRTLPEVYLAQQKMRKRYSELKYLTLHPKVPTLHVCLQVSDVLSDESQASILQTRVMSRGELAHFDPTNVQASLARVRASKELRDILLQDRQAVITITTDKPFNFNEFNDRLIDLL